MDDVMEAPHPLPVQVCSACISCKRGQNQVIQTMPASNEVTPNQRAKARSDSLVDEDGEVVAAGDDEEEAVLGAGDEELPRSSSRKRKAPPRFADHDYDKAKKKQQKTASKETRGRKKKKREQDALVCLSSESEENGTASANKKVHDDNDTTDGAKAIKATEAMVDMTDGAATGSRVVAGVASKVTSKVTVVTGDGVKLQKIHWLKVKINQCDDTMIQFFHRLLFGNNKGLDVEQMRVNIVHFSGFFPKRDKSKTQMEVDKERDPLFRKIENRILNYARARLIQVCELLELAHKADYKPDYLRVVLMRFLQEPKPDFAHFTKDRLFAIAQATTAGSVDDESAASSASTASSPATTSKTSRATTSKTSRATMSQKNSSSRPAAAAAPAVAHDTNQKKKTAPPNDDQLEDFCTNFCKCVRGAPTPKDIGVATKMAARYFDVEVTDVEKKVKVLLGSDEPIKDFCEWYVQGMGRPAAEDICNHVLPMAQKKLGAHVTEEMLKKCFGI